MFLGWIPQLLAYLNTEKIFAISPIVQRIAETYPQAIMFHYRLSRESYNKSQCTIISSELQLLTDRYL